MKDTYFTSDNIEKLNFLLRTKPDDYCLPDGTIVRLDGMLYYYFKKEMGYDNVVFYSPGKGLYFYDEETYEYFCPKPDETLAQATAKFSDNIDALQSRRSRNTGGNAGSNEGAHEAKVIASVSHEELPDQTQLSFNLNFEQAYPRIVKLLNDRKHKNVVIIKDTVSFLESAGETPDGRINQKDTSYFLRNWDQMLLDTEQNKNIVVWITMGQDNVAGYPYFRDRNSTESTPQISKDKVTIVQASVIGVGEIKNLINSFRLKLSQDGSIKGLRVDFADYDKLCTLIFEKLMRYGLSLRDLSDIFTMLESAKKPLDPDNFLWALGRKLEDLKLKEEKDETYEETLGRYDKQEKIEQYIEGVKRKAEGFEINEKRASMHTYRLEPPQKTKFQELLARQQNAFNLHLALVGPPGTGKTTFAKIIAKAYKELGLLPSEKFVKVTRADLVGAYVGHTAIKTKGVIDRAMGGTLFIDEAYTLARSGASSNDFGLEAIDTLVEAMTDRMGEFAVIIAGYENDIKKMISANEGLQSRFSSIISMTPYPTETLCNKFRRTVYDLSREYKNLGEATISKEMDDNLASFIVALERDYDLRKENGRSGWASMRTIIQLATTAANSFSGRLQRDPSAKKEMTIEDLPSREAAIFRTILPKKPVESDEFKDAPAAAEFRGKAKDDKLFTMRQLALWDESNPMRGLLREFGKLDKEHAVAFRRVYQGTVVYLFKKDERMGTGTLISPHGHILTANHVAQGVDTARIYKYSADGRHAEFEDFPVKTVRAGQDHDIAVMQMQGDVSTPLYASLWAEGAFRNVDKETEICIFGYPFGIQATDGPIFYKGQVAGVSVEGKDDDVLGTEILNLQTEGKSGNSGSPLFNNNMEIVGVFVHSRTNRSGELVEEINRALPIKYFYDEFVSKEGR